MDFQDIWRRQAMPPMLVEVLTKVAKTVHGVLVDPEPGISNVTEWAKKQVCWNRVSKLEVAWPQPFLDDLISIDERRDATRGARREQRELNSIETQIAVVEAGPRFWEDVLEWGSERGLLTPTEAGLLRMAVNCKKKMPTERQCCKVVEVLSKLRSKGYVGEL